MVWRPSVQPWVRCCGEQFHPPQQLLVWSRVFNAARYGGTQAAVAPHLPLLSWVLPAPAFCLLNWQASQFSFCDCFTRRVTCRELRSSVLCDKGELLSPSCRFQRQVVGAMHLSKIVSRGWKTLPHSFSGNRLVGPAQDFSDVGMKRVHWGTCLTNTSCHPC